jgi:hypothetical protein
MTHRNRYGDYVAPGQYSVEELRSTVFRERSAADQTLDELTALSLLLTFTYEGKLEDLQRILRDEKRDNRLRHSAAIGISRMDRTVAEEILIDMLAVDEPVVLRGVLKGLGYAGSERTLPLLKQVAQRSTGSLRQVAEWAATMIAYRENGGDEFNLGLPNNLVIPYGDSVSEIAIRRADRDLLERAIRDIRQEFMNGRFSPETGWEISCLNNTYILLLDTSIVMDPRTLTRRKMIAGAVLSFARVEEERWYVRYYVLTHAITEGEGAIFLTAGRGNIPYFGSFDQADEGVAFQLRATSAAGVLPVDIEGALFRQRLEISRAIMSPQFVRVNTPSSGRVPAQQSG